MNRSESIKELATALAKAQGEIGAAIKSATNPHFRSKYADLASVIEAIKGPLSKNGIAFLQGVKSVAGGVAVETMLVHTSGESMSETLEIPVSKNDAQGIGSAITYGKRYGLQSLVGVPSEDDDGNAATVAKPTGLPETQRVDFENAIETAADPDALKKLWQKASAACKEAEDMGAYKTLKAKTETRAAELKGLVATQA